MPTAGQAFRVVAPFKPSGDQPEAIAGLTSDLRAGEGMTCLLGATGTGKTFTMANVIAELGKPTLIVSHNKTLAAQLYEELKEFLPDNSVNYFVSYYDYYQPEAYIPARDIYIEKDSSRNDDLDRLRLAATSNILSRRDTVVIASVSCIFGLGSPEAYGQKVLTLTRGSSIDRRSLLMALNAMQYQRSDVEWTRGKYRVRGEVVEVWPAYERYSVRIECFGSEIERLDLVNPTSGEVLAEENQFFLFPAVHYVMPEDQLAAALKAIREELEARVMQLRSEGKLLEAQRLIARTSYDLELIEETGVCPGIENYSRFLDGRAPGERPFTLLDYFDYAPTADQSDQSGVSERTAPTTTSISPTSEVARALRPNFRDWLLIIDESHVTVPQVRAMFNGDQARKKVLVEHGFRLPSAMDNRPLRFEEFESIVPQVMYVSATPAGYELERTGGQVHEQVIRPTGLLDPEVTVKPADTQVQDLLERCRERVERNHRVLVTTVTKKLSEDLASYLDQQGLKVKYLHSEVDTLDRVEILAELREGKFDVLVGVNLLREGLDLPEVGLVAILDADKEGYLRSATSLIQTMGRAARNSESEVIMYADSMTAAMQHAIDETQRRRIKQIAYNTANGIVPMTIRKDVRRGMEAELKAGRTARSRATDTEPAISADQLLSELEADMLEAAEALQFERAANARDQLVRLRQLVELHKADGDKKPLSFTRSEIEASLGGRPRKSSGSARSKRGKQSNPGEPRRKAGGDAPSRVRKPR